ncbi:MAG: homocysteine S-methyltransferase family protein [Armatimonadota bacterium]|nr:homocysteine S-methyltransferase family protein [Armatimonadota bacterium]
MDVLEQLNRGRILISDGAWGTELDARGLPAGEPPERWVLDNPNAVLDLARAYAESGPDILMTPTMGGTRITLARAGLADHVEQINRRALELSKQAAAGPMPVFASVGPTGEFMEPLGEVSEAEMVAAFAEQMRVLIAAGADGIVIETMFDLDETRAALRAVNEHSDVPVVVSMTFDKGQRGYATIMGVSPQQAAEELQAAGADVVGSNCGHGIAEAIEVTRLMRPATDLPLWCKPNAGMPRLEAGQAVFDQTPEEMASHFGELVAAGAQVIGGCCGTTPEHIRALIQARDEMTGNQSQ